MAATNAPSKPLPKKHKPLNASPSRSLTSPPSSPSKKKKTTPGSSPTKAKSRTNSQSSIQEKGEIIKKPSTSRKPAIVVSEEPVAVVLPSQGEVPSVDRPQKQTTLRKKKAKDRKEPRRLCYIIWAVGCCLLILLIIGLVLGLVVFRNRGNDRENSGSAQAGQTNEDAPTPSVNNPSIGSDSSPTFSDPTRSPVQSQTGAPTIMPTTGGGNSTPNSTPKPSLRPSMPPAQSPILAPTSVLQPSPSQIIILPYADTFIYRDGFTSFEAFGTDDTFLVQNGPAFVRDDVADAVGLLAFDVASGLSAEGISANAIQQITLRLFHEPAVWNRGAATLTIRRLASTTLAIETLHAGLFDPADDEGITGPSFSVHPDDTIVEVDVTDLLSSDQDDVFLMIENKGAEQVQGAEGDRFFTRETNNPPQLILTMM